MTHSLFDNGSEHVARVLDGDPAALERLFAERVAAWDLPFIHGEGGTYGLFSDVEERIAPHVAFALVPTAVEIITRQKAQRSLHCALSLLLGLVEATETTEVPPTLRERWPALQAIVAPFGTEISDSWNAIRAHYRNAF